MLDDGPNVRQRPADADARLNRISRGETTVQLLVQLELPTIPSSPSPSGQLHLNRFMASQLRYVFLKTSLPPLRRPRRVTLQINIFGHPPS